MANWDSTFDYTMMIAYINNLNVSINENITTLNAEIVDLQNMSPELVVLVQDDINIKQKKIQNYQDEIAKTTDLLNKIPIVQALSSDDKQVLYDIYVILGSYMELFAQMQLVYYNELIMSARPVLTTAPENMKKRLILTICAKYLNGSYPYFPLIGNTMPPV